MMSGGLSRVSIACLFHLLWVSRRPHIHIATIVWQPRDPREGERQEITACPGPTSPNMPLISCVEACLEKWRQAVSVHISLSSLPSFTGSVLFGRYFTSPNNKSPKRWGARMTNDTIPSFAHHISHRCLSFGKYGGREWCPLSSLLPISYTLFPRLLAYSFLISPKDDRACKRWGKATRKG